MLGIFWILMRNIMGFILFSLMADENLEIMA